MSDKIADIRERHKASDNNFIEYESTWDIHADRATLLAEVDRLRADLALEKSGFVLQRGQVEKLRAKIDELMRSHEMCANAMRAESDRADEAWAEVEKLRAEIERLRKVYVLIATESAGIVEGGSIFEDKIAGCYASHQSADKAGENLGYVNWRIEEHTIISNALEGKP